jgi:hypothetical protein
MLMMMRRRMDTSPCLQTLVDIFLHVFFKGMSEKI